MIPSSLPCDVPFIIGGDFDCILSYDDKKGSKHFMYYHAVKELEYFMLRCDLQELESNGVRYTWYNNKDDHNKIWVRLDHVLINFTASLELRDTKVKNLAHITSNHYPFCYMLLFL